MSRTMTVSGEIVVDVPADRLYEMVADPVQMARWSPENTGATTSRPGPARVGDRFLGTNLRGRMRWVTESVVTAAEPSERFAFRVERWGVRRPALRIPNASWEYRFEPVGGGTRVVETWTDDRRSWPDALAAVVDRLATGGQTFASFQTRNIRATLDRLKTDAEAGTGG